LKNGARHNYFKALFGVLGNITALLLFASLSALGLGAILLASPKLFLVVKLIGSFYLCYLGIKLWRARATPTTITDTVSFLNTSNLEVYREGLLVGITNPKTIIFFAALFPQFISFEQTFLLQFFILAITIALQQNYRCCIYCLWDWFIDLWEIVLVFNK